MTATANATATPTASPAASTAPTTVASDSSSIEPVKGTLLFWGEAATTELVRLFDRSREEDATGRTWVLPATFGPWEEAAFRMSVDDMSSMEVVVIDSGNINGDAWKYTYYPGTKVGMYCQEA